MQKMWLCLGVAVAVASPALLPAQESSFESLPWQEGPTTGELGEEASIGVPGNCLFLPGKAVPQFMALTQNPSSGEELGIVFCSTGQGEDRSSWFVIFEFESSGYVKDDEKNDLDSRKILASIKSGTEQANRERRRMGWSTLTVNGWVYRPYYDETTNNLTWAIMGTDDADGQQSVNHSVRLLGRSGVMNVDLVADPAQHEQALEAFGEIIAGFAFKPGHKYSEWRAGDKVAAYGLTALVAGGAGALAVKSGLLGKFWKVLAGLAAAALAGIKTVWARIRGDR